MAKLKELIAVILLITVKFKLITGQYDENTKLLMERMDSIEATQALHGFKIELIETEVMGLKKKVSSLEIKNQDILSDLSKLDGKVNELGISVTSLNSPKGSLSKIVNKLKTGIPTNCSDLQLLGHSNNGLYLVKKSKPNHQGTKIETVYCDFQSHVNSKEFETRIGVMDVKSSPVYFHVEGIKEDKFDAGNRLKLTFKKQISNVGGGFDWKNQFFRAPYTGTYSFSISGSKDTNTYTTRANIAVRFNFGEIIAEALSSAFTQHGGFACQFTRKLKANDTIELAMHFGKAYFLYFTGFLMDENLII